MRCLNLLKTLVEFNTDSERGTQFAECAEYLKGALENVCDRVRFIGKKERPNVYAEINNGCNTTLGFCCHYDVVPPGEGWKTDPWKLTIKKGRAFGRGVADDKGNIASLISALEQIKRAKYNVKVLVTPDEEIGGRIGLEYLLRKHLSTVKANCYYVLDSSPEYISVGCSGVMAGRIVVKGRGGHAGYDFLCDNPLWKLDKVIAVLKGYRRIRERKVSSLRAYKGPKRNLYGRFNITVIRAGCKFNVIPNSVEIMFDARLLPEEKLNPAENELKKYLESHMKVDYELKIETGAEGYCLRARHMKYAELLKDAVRRATGRRLEFYGEFGRADSSYFARFNIPSVGYGILRREYNIHAANEFVRIEDLTALERVLIKLLEG